MTYASPSLTASTLVTVLLPPPTITSFTPSSGKVGTQVTLTGTNLAQTTGVAFMGAAASFTILSATQVTTTVPTGATTGPLTLTTPGGSVTTAGVFIVLPIPDFALTVDPLTVPVIQGISVSLSVRTVTTGGFTGLTQLSTGSLPTGATATFAPPFLGPNAAGVLTLTTSGSTSIGSLSIEVRGTASLDGTATTRTATAALTVQAPGQTVLMGQVRDEDDQPLAGVTISRAGPPPQVLGVTDAGGNFLVAVPGVGAQVFLVDGSTANTGSRTYHTIPLTVAITPGAVNPLGFTVYLHVRPTPQPLPVAPAGATPVTFPTVPDLTLTIPARVSIIGWDGQANTQIGVRPVPLDRLPLPPLPAGVQTTTVYMFTFGKVGGGTPKDAAGTAIPIPVTAPNTIGAYPGQQVELWYYNEAPDGSAPNQWERFGYGTVSNDGKLIVSNPGVGIPRFCCGAWFPRRPPPPQNTPPDEGAPDPCPDCDPPPPGACPGDCEGSAPEGDPVQVSSGIFLQRMTDLTLPGRIPVVLTRIYRTNDPTLGPFGIGTSSSYDAYLRPKTPDLVIVFLPGNYKSRWARQPDGSYTVGDKGPFRGAQLSRNPDTTWTLRYKDGRHWQFNGAGWLIAQQDRNGNQLTITRDGQNRISSLREPGGRELTMTYSGSDLKIQSVQDPLGRQVSYTYDASSRLTQVTDPAGGTWQYTYDGSHRMLTVTNPRGIRQTQNTYEAAGSVATQTFADGGVIRFSYTVIAGTIVGTQVTDPLGNTRSYRFEKGYPTERIDALGQSAKTTRASGTSLVQAQVDRLGRTTTFAYESGGNVIQQTVPLGQVWTYSYEPVFNRLLSSIDPLGHATALTYDATGNLSRITDPLGHQITLTYNPFGQPVSVTDALGNTTTFEYDSAGNLTARADPLGNRTEWTYDAVSRILAIKDPNGAVTSFSYDALDRLVTNTDALNGVTAFSYDLNLNPARIAEKIRVEAAL